MGAGTDRETAMSGGERKAARVLRGAAGMAAALALAAGAADARPRTLGHDESQALLAGNTVYGYNPRNDDTFKMFHSTDGGVRAELRNVNGQVSESAGRWWITDEGKLCVDWANYRWIDSCTSVVQDGDAVSFVDDSGRIVSFAEVKPGNPDDL